MTIHKNGFTPLHFDWFYSQLLEKEPFAYFNAENRDLVFHGIACFKVIDVKRKKCLNKYKIVHVS